MYLLIDVYSQLVVYVHVSPQLVLTVLLYITSNVSNKHT